MRIVRGLPLLAAFSLLPVLAFPSFAASISSVTGFPTVATVNNIGAGAPSYPNITVATVTLSSVTGSGAYAWQTGGCGAIDNVTWLRPAATPPLTGCYKLVGFSQPTVSGYLPISGGTLTGNLLFTDGLYDIGASGATRPRNLFLSGTATIGSLTATRVPYAGTGGLLSDDSGFTYNSATHAITVTTVVAALTGHASSDLSLSAAAQAYSGGVRITSFSIGTKSSGTYQVDCGNGPQQYLTNGGAFTLSAPANDGNCLVETINNASAGTITPSGFSPSACSGDAMTTTNTSKFLISIITINATSTCIIKALQ